MNYIDTHCHCLWSVDDASQSEETSLKMLTTAYENGVTQIICTPHCAPDVTKYKNDRKHLEIAFHKAEALLQKHGIPIDLYLGSELYLSDLAMDWVRKNKITTMNDTDYLLVEFPWHISVKMKQTELEMIQEIIQLGYKVIIAHPERYTCFQENYDLMKMYREMGCYFQINRTSLLFPQVENYDLAWNMVMDGYADIIATDAHHAFGNRVIILDDIYHIILDKIGKSKADLLCIHNPQAIIDGKPLNNKIVSK